MVDGSEISFEDERETADDAAVDEAIRTAGGERPAIRALLVAVAEAKAALAATSSLGYRRGRQPARRFL